MAEIEFNVLAQDCLRRRIADEDSLQNAVSACVSERNTAAATIDRLALRSQRCPN